MKEKNVFAEEGIMDIGIGIPNTVPDTTGEELLDWAQRADEAGFSSLGSIGAVSYPGYEELTVFAAAATVTDRIRLVSNMLIAPTRSTAELAKQAASVDQLSGGRLTLGLSPGWREPDYRLAGRDFDGRGRAFDEQLRDLQTAWRGEALVEGTRPVGPAPVQKPGIPILIGGQTDAAVRRTVEYGIGWSAGGLPPEAVSEMAEKVRSAWKDAGRDGDAKIVALAYFSLGGTEEAGRRYLLHYYEPMGRETAQQIADSVMTSDEAIGGAIDAFADAGVDEFILDPTVSDPKQVDLLTDIVF